LPVHGLDVDEAFRGRDAEVPLPLDALDLGVQVPLPEGRGLGVQPPPLPPLPPLPEAAFFGFHSPAFSPDVRGLGLGFHSPVDPPDAWGLAFGFHPLPSLSRGPALAGLDFHPSLLPPS
jgi:hypothetical protein